MAVIELDLYAPAESPSRHLRPAPHAYRYAGLALVVALVSVLGGAAPPMSVMWRAEGVVPVSERGEFTLAGNRIYTFDLQGTALETTAWSISPSRRLWHTTSRVRTRYSDGTPLLRWYVQAIGDDVLLTVDLTTTALDARTGTVRWRSPDPVYRPGPGPVGLVYEQHYPPGTEYDDESGVTGEIYYSNNGVPHSEPPLRTVVRALDLGTGTVLWTGDYPGEAFAVEASGAPGSLLILGSDRISVVAAATGAVLSERRLSGPPPRSERWILPQLVGDRLMIRRGGTVTAYEIPALTPMWQRDETSVDGINLYTCDDLFCAAAETDVMVLDPATGRPRWRVPLNTRLIGLDGAVAELAADSTQPIGVRDPVTGATRINLRQWAWLAGNPTADSMVLGRPDAGGTEFAALRRGAGTLQPLGRTATLAMDCQVDGRHVACRGISGVLIWSYPA